MGMNVVPLRDLTPDEPKILTLELLKNMDPNDVQNEKSRGQIILEVTYKPFQEGDAPKEGTDDDSGAVEKAPEGTPSGGGLLVVIVHEAQDLEGKHHTNPYVRVIFRGEERKTRVSCSCICSISNNFLQFVIYLLSGILHSTHFNPMCLCVLLSM